MGGCVKCLNVGNILEIRIQLMIHPLDLLITTCTIARKKQLDGILASFRKSFGSITDIKG